uniref:Putative transcriptional regulator n=1 Tax=termite gut metagenome TaxID=433724 RepID=S0DEC1_9ZZZZ
MSDHESLMTSDAPELLDQKPTRHIKMLIDAMMPWSETFNAQKGELLRYQVSGRKMCYMLHGGSISLHRRGDGLVLNSESMPFIIGICNLSSHGDSFYLRTRENMRMSRIPQERFMILVEKFALWESLAKLVIYTASRFYDHCTQLTQLSAYEIIRFKLLELMDEPDVIRLNTTAAMYIQNRTFLSRSGIMRILSELKQAEYVTMQRGVLIAINHLPEKY